MANIRGGLVHYNGACRDCGKQFYTKNAFGIASQHAQRYGHQVWLELGYHYEIVADGSVPVTGGAAAKLNTRSREA